MIAAVVTAALFSLAHVPGDWPTFLDRFAFGLAASAVVWLTGGLEAAIVLHAANNVLVFLLAGALGDGVATEEVPEGTGLLFLLASVLTMAVYVALVARSNRRLRPETATAAHGPADARRPGSGARPLTRRPGVGATCAQTVGYRLLRRREVPPMGYGVIGSPTVSGSVSLGSSPGTPARKHRSWRCSSSAAPHGPVV